MFVNLSNHSSRDWSNAQLSAAVEIGGEILDVAFPEVPPEWQSDEVGKLAEKISAELAALAPLAVMIQGEFTLTYRLILNLSRQSITCYAATTRRVVENSRDEEGHMIKKSRFEFVRFRRYE